jgi:hypothetical protein
MNAAALVLASCLFEGRPAVRWWDRTSGTLPGQSGLGPG